MKLDGPATCRHLRAVGLERSVRRVLICSLIPNDTGRRLETSGNLEYGNASYNCELEISSGKYAIKCYVCS